MDSEASAVEDVGVNQCAAAHDLYSAYPLLDTKTGAAYSGVGLIQGDFMKNRLLLFLVIAGVMFAAMPADAHHSFGATYNVDKEVTLEGKVVQVSLRSPHSFFFVEAKDENGEVHRWSVEGAGAGQFAQQGVTRDSFKVGDPVKVIANPARSPDSYRARMIKITRTTDGKSWGGRPGEVVD